MHHFIRLFSLFVLKRQGLANFFCKAPDSIYFRLFEPCGLGYRQFINTWVGLCPDKTLFTKTNNGPDLACGPQFNNLCFKAIAHFFSSPVELCHVVQPGSSLTASMLIITRFLRKKITQSSIYSDLFFIPKRQLPQARL